MKNVLLTLHPRRLSFEQLEHRRLLTIVWDGGGDGTNWHDPRNWQPNVIPGATAATADELVVIESPTATTVIVSDETGSVAIAGLLTAVPLALTGGSLQVNDVALYQRPVLLQGGALGGRGESLLTDTLIWTGGSLGTQSEGIFRFAGNVLLDGDQNKVLGPGSFDNAAAWVWRGAGNIVVDRTESFHNLQDALFAVETDASFEGSGGTFDFTNAGLFVKSAGDATTAFNAASTFVNEGHLQVEVGTLEFNAASSAGGGDIEVAAGATLRYAASEHVYTGDVAVGGSGKIEVVGGTLEFATGAVSVEPDVVLISGTFGGDGRVHLDGGLTWTGGTLGSDAAGTIVFRGGVSIGGTAEKVLGSGLFRNESTWDWQGTGNLIVHGAQVFENAENATFQVQTDADFKLRDGSLSFHNEGLFIKTEGQATTEIPAEFLNLGQLRVDRGAFQISAPFAPSTGHFDIAVGATLIVNSPLHLVGDAVLAGAGTVDANVINQGLVTPGHPVGRLTIAGDFLQLGEGRLEMEIAGLAAGLDSDQLHVTGDVDLGGSLRIAALTHFLPIDGESFEILKYTERRGGFRSIEGLDPIPSVEFIPSLLGDRMVLEVDISGSTPFDPLHAPERLDEPVALLSDVDSVQVTPDGQVLVYLMDNEHDQRLGLFAADLRISWFGELSEPTENVNEFQLTPNSRRAVYRADDSSLVSVEVLSALDRSEFKLDAGRRISDFQISPDGEWVVYTADQDIEGVTELYVVPTNALNTAPIKLSGPLVAGGSVQSFQIDAQSARVVYIADQDTDNVHELYSVSIDGTGTTKLNDVLGTGGDVARKTPSGEFDFSDVFWISHNGDQVAYLADQEREHVLELYSVPITGGAATKLNGTMTAGGDVSTVVISRDDRNVLYLADQETDGIVELFSVPLLGGDARKLNSTLTDGAMVQTFEPTESHVVYWADQDIRGVRELYSVPIEGGEVVKLNPSMDGGDVASFAISDSQQVVFSVSLPESTAVVYVAPVAGGPATELTRTLVDGSSVNDIQIARNSRVIYRADHSMSGVQELFSVPIDGGRVVKLNEQLVVGGGVTFFGLNDADDRVFYLADQEIPGVQELYATHVDGGSVPIALNRRPNEERGDVVQMLASSDGVSVVYRADHFEAGVFELISVSSRLKWRRPTPNLVSGGDVMDFQITPHRDRLVYLADKDTDEVFELYVVPIQGGTATKLSEGLADGGDVHDFALSPDGSRVVYLADRDMDGVDELFSVAITGGESTRLNGPLVAGGSVSGFQIAADGTFLVYRADQEDDETHELYTSSLAGGTSRKLNGELPNGGGVQDDFQIAAASDRVVYRADQDAVGAVELYGTTLVGEAVKLSGPLVDGGVVHDFQLSADGQAVVYRSGGDGEGLYSVHFADGSLLRLSGPDNQVQTGYRVSDDSSQVVFLASRAAGSIDELYSVPLRGGSVARLNAPLVADGTVRAGFQVSADSNRVVYLANQDTVDKHELYSVPITGGSAMKLNGPLAGNEVYFDFQISPDSRQVVYRAEQESAGVVELYRVPIDGGESRRMHGDIAAGGAVQPGFQFTKGNHVLFRGDLDQANVVDLYRVPMQAGTKMNSHPAAPEGSVGALFDVSPDGRFALYTGHDPEGVFWNYSRNLFSVSLTTGVVTKLNDPLPPGHRISGIKFSPDSQTVLFGAGLGFLETDLFSVPIWGGTPAKLDSGVRSFFGDFMASPDGSQVIYAADDELRSVSIRGGPITTLTRQSPNVVRPSNIGVSPDGSRVVFVAEQAPERTRALFSVPATGGVAVRLSVPEEAGPSPSFRISADGTDVVYRARTDQFNFGELYRVAIDGGESVRLSNPGDHVVDFAISPDNQHVVYLSFDSRLFHVPLAGGTVSRIGHDVGPDDRIDRDGPPRFEISPDSSRVVYVVQRRGMSALFATPIGGGDVVRLTDFLKKGVTAESAGVSDQFGITPDGSQVIHANDIDRDGFNDLLTVPIEGGPRERWIPLPPGRNVLTMNIARVGNRVVYNARSAGPYQLFLGAPRDPHLRLDSRSGDVRVQALGPLLQIVGSHVRLWSEQSLIDTDSLALHATGMLNRLTLDYSAGGFFALPAGLTLTPSGSGGVEELIVRGNGNTTAALASTAGSLAEARVVTSLGSVASSLEYSGAVSLAIENMLEVDILGTLKVGDHTLSVDANEFTDLGEATFIEGGVIHAHHGLHLGTTELIQGHGLIVGPIVSEQGSTITLTGNLSLGNALALDGVNLNGRLNIGANTIELLDADRAVLGSQSVLGSDNDVGTLNAVNGVALKEDRTLVGQGVVNTASAEFENQGFVQGIGSGIVFNDPVTGTGNFGGVISFNGGTVFSDGPTRTSVQGGVTLGPENVHWVEIGGIEAGSQHDQLIVDGMMHLNGSIQLARIQADNGYRVAPGDRFSIIEASAILGQFVGLPEGARISRFLDSELDAVISYQGGSVVITVETPRSLHVTSIEPSGSGASVGFTDPIVLDSLNVYDTVRSAFGPADATLIGAETGQVAGSFVLATDLRSGTFIATGGPLPDDTYTLRLSSGADGFTTADGRLLDGDGDEQPGDDYERTFVTSRPADSLVASLPDFVRGPGQPVDVPADGVGGIPVSISNASLVRIAQFRIAYDPRLLTVEGAALGPAMPQSSTVEVDTTVVGIAVVTFTSPTALPAGNQVLAQLTAVVPASADIYYGQQQVVQIVSAELQDAEGRQLGIVLDDAVHLVSYFGDVSGNKRIDSSDAARLARVTALIDGGFDATPLTDPRLVADISGNGLLNASDASLLARFVALLEVPKIPAIPSAAIAGAATLASLPAPNSAPDPSQQNDVKQGPTAFSDWGKLTQHWASVDAVMDDRREIEASMVDEWWDHLFAGMDEEDAAHAFDADVIRSG